MPPRLERLLRLCIDDNAQAFFDQMPECRGALGCKLSCAIQKRVVNFNRRLHPAILPSTKMRMKANKKGRQRELAAFF
jgi:hypothetical protein